MFTSCIYEGQVMHHRFRPARHRFVYSVASMLVNLDELKTLDKTLRFFSVNRWNIFSFHNKDHGNGSNQPISDQIREILSEHELQPFAKEIKLLCYPRMFGYVFNPLSVFYCYDDDQRLGAIIYEVNNTFGERHSYLIKTGEKETTQIRQKADKQFYVSPFMPMDAPYQFRMLAPKDRVSVCIRQTDEQGSLLHAVFNGTRTDLSDKSLTKIFFKYPLMTLKVIAGIHWEAFRLWRKGVPLQQRIKRGTNKVTLITEIGRSTDASI